MEKQRAIVRKFAFIPNQEELIIFFNDQIEAYFVVMSWMEVGQHEAACVEFYRQTKKVDKKEAQDFLNKYCALYNCKNEFVLREKFDYSVFRNLRREIK